MSDDRERVRARIDLVDLVGQRVNLRKTGRTWKGLCPFHDDKNPSFTVNPDLGRYKCWSCGAQGDCFTWVMETQRVDFREALQLLADAVGVTLTKTKGERAEPSRREAQDAAMAAALAFFRTEFERHSLAREYGESRGLDPSTIQAWQLGYAPDINAALATHLRKQGHDLALCRELFLVDRDGAGGYFDKFRGRLMVPIHDEKGRLVAFGGRLLGSGQAKYINSGETPIFQKSKTLFAFHRARDTMQKTGIAVLVEGYFDVIACHRAGVTNAVAPMGTSLTEDQVRLLSRWCQTVVLLLDGDEAGQKAVERSAELLEKQNLEVKVALIPSGDDPDTLRRREGDAAVREAVAHAVSALAFRLRRVETHHKPESDDYWKAIAHLIAQAPTPLERTRLVQEYAPRYPGIKDPVEARRALQAMVNQAGRRAQRLNPRTPQAKGPQLGLIAPEIALWYGILDPVTRPACDQAMRETDLMESANAERYAMAYRVTFPDGPPSGPVGQWLHQLEDEDLKSLLTFLAERDPEPEEAVAGAADQLRRRRDLRLSRIAAENPKPDDDWLAQFLEHQRRVRGHDEPAEENSDDPFA